MSTENKQCANGAFKICTIKDPGNTGEYYIGKVSKREFMRLGKQLLVRLDPLVKVVTIGNSPPRAFSIEHNHEWLEKDCRPIPSDHPGTQKYESSNGTIITLSSLKEDEEAFNKLLQGPQASA